MSHIASATDMHRSSY